MKGAVPSLEQLFHAAALIPIFPSRGGGNFPHGWRRGKLTTACSLAGGSAAKK
jgi:hypothetical protein